MKALGLSVRPSCLQHVLDRLDAVGHLGRLVAGAGEAGNKAIADQLIVARPFDLDEVFEPFARGRRA